MQFSEVIQFITTYIDDSLEYPSIGQGMDARSMARIQNDLSPGTRKKLSYVLICRQNVLESLRSKTEELAYLLPNRGFQDQNENKMAIRNRVQLDTNQNDNVNESASESDGEGGRQEESFVEQKTTHMGRFVKYGKIGCGHLCATPGLTIIVIGYLLLGSYIFVKMEVDYDQFTRKTMEKTINATMAEIYDNADWMRIGLPGASNDTERQFEETWVNLQHNNLHNYAKAVHPSVTNKGWEGDFILDNAPYVWNYISAFLFSLTIVTTIGYGNITPHSIEGRSFSVIYALFGIPITMMCLANIGHALGLLFKGMYSCACVKWCKEKKAEKKAKKKAKKHPQVKNDTNLPNGEDIEGGLTSAEKEALGVEGLNDEEPIDLHDVQVPLLVTIGILITYLLFGALLFSQLEKKRCHKTDKDETSGDECWDFGTGFYYSFVTLSTIGFGDFVFGAGQDTNEDSDITIADVFYNNDRMLLTCFYIIMGLSLLSMSYDLMHREIGRLVGVFRNRINPNKDTKDNPVGDDKDNPVGDDKDKGETKDGNN